MVFEDTGSFRQASLTERIEILSHVLDRTGVETAFEKESVQSGWTRLAYSGPQAAAMRLYDSGNKADLLTSAWVVFVPRVLWPGKPNLSPGDEFYKMITRGTSNTLVGISIYADSYWHHGWTGVVVIGMIIGGILLLLSLNTLNWIDKGAFLYLPLILLAMQIAMLGPTRYVLNGFISPLPIYLAYMIGLKIFFSIKIRKDY